MLPEQWLADCSTAVHSSIASWCLHAIPSEQEDSLIIFTTHHAVGGLHYSHLQLHAMGHQAACEQ